ncbi:MAG: hypothetical protein IKD50_12345 [Clostridia bacterium]|nr:hypothetical protein [Clostridia bacterium]
MENKNKAMELTLEDMEKVNGGSWLGRIWNKIKSFGGGSGKTEILEIPEKA